MTEGYIRTHFADIKRFANVIENRLDDSDCTMESVLEDHKETMNKCRQYGIEPVLIDTDYSISIEL